ncbi:MAG: tetratricopeptide repeat protein, partial [Flavisolibacter sp.]
DFEKAIQLDNKIPSPYYNLSMCYYATNRFADACNAFRQAKESGLNIDDVEKQKEYKLISELCK